MPERPMASNHIGSDVRGIEVHGQYRFSLRSILGCITFVAVGLSLCLWQSGSQHWGNWLHSATFNVGLLILFSAVGLFVAGVKTAWTGMIAFAVLVCLAIALLWTFPGWLALHTLIWNLTQ